GQLTITDSGGTTFQSTVDALNVTITDTTATNTVAFQGALNVDTGLTVSAGAAYHVSITGGINTIAGATTFNNAGNVTLGDGGDTINFTGGVVATAPALVNLAGTLNSTNSTIQLGDAGTPVVLLANTTVNTGAGIGNIVFGGTVNGAFSLQLDAGSGNVQAVGVIGTSAASANRLAAFTVAGATTADLDDVFTSGAQSVTAGTINLNGTTYRSTADALTFNGSTVLADNITVTSGAGADDDITFDGTVNGAFTLNLVAGAGGDVEITGIVGTSAGHANNLTGFTVTSAAIADLDDVFTAGAQSVTAGTINLNGTTYDSDAGALTFDGATRLFANVTVTSGGGANDDITFDGTVNGGFTLDLVAGASGDVEITGVVGTSAGSGNRLAGFTVSSALIANLDDVFTSGAQSVTAGTINLRGTTYTSTANALAFNGSVVLHDDITVTGTGGAGNVTFTGGVTGPFDLTVNAGNQASFNTSVGTDLTAVSVNAPSLSLANNVSLQTDDGPITFAIDELLLGGNNSIDAGTAIFQITTFTANASIEFAPTDTGLADTFIDSDFAGINAGLFLLGDATHEGAIHLGNGVGGVVAAYDLTVRNDNANVIFEHDYSGAGFDLIVDATAALADSITITTALVNFGSTLAGDSNALTITGNLDLDGAATGLTALSVSGTSNLGANVTSTGTQTYTGATTLSGGNRTLTGSTVNFGSTLAGGTNSLTITGNLDLDGAATGLTSLAVSGTSNLGANVTSTGTQTYTGATTLSGGNRTLTGTTVNFGSTLAGGGNALAVSGNLDLDGAATGLSTVSVSGASNLGADVTTTGMQDYNGPVTLSGGDRTLSTAPGQIIETSGIAGGGNSLVVNGDFDVLDAITGVNDLTVNGSTYLEADVTTTGNQAYNGFVIMGASPTLAAGGTVTFASTIDDPFNLTISGSTVTFNGAIGATNALTSLTVTGATDINGGSVETTGAQTYNSAVTLGGATTLDASVVNFGSTLAGGSNALTITGNLDLDGAATGLTSLAVSGTSNLGANVTSTGTQTY
ncbi:MAG: hypothetical protein WD803_05420, partial [Gammaproteobacteria bacterium]